MDYKSGPIQVVPTSHDHQFWICDVINPGPELDYIKNIVSFSGYFGTYGPHMFVAAPEMYAALKEARDALNGAPNTTGLHTQINAALAKAEGK